MIEIDERTINENYQKAETKRAIIDKIGTWTMIGTVVLCMILIVALGNQDVDTTLTILFTMTIAFGIEYLIYKSLINNIYIPPKPLSLTKDIQNKIIKDLLANWDSYEWEYTKLHDFVGYQAYYCERYVLIGNYLMYDDNISLLITTNWLKRYADEVNGMEDVEMFTLDNDSIQDVIKLYNTIEENYSQIASDRENSKKWSCLIKHISN